MINLTMSSEERSMLETALDEAIKGDMFDDGPAGKNRDAANALLKKLRSFAPHMPNS